MNQEIIEQWYNKFNLCLGIDFSDPEYFKVHHILVMAFMIQTGRYTPDYYNEVMSLFKEFLLHPLETPDRLKVDIINKKFSSRDRDNNIIKKEFGDIIETNFTILDIRTNTADVYCQDVITWAKEIIDKISTK